MTSKFKNQRKIFPIGISLKLCKEIVCNENGNVIYSDMAFKTIVFSSYIICRGLNNIVKCGRYGKAILMTQLFALCGAASFSPWMNPYAYVAAQGNDYFARLAFLLFAFSHLHNLIPCCRCKRVNSTICGIEITHPPQRCGFISYLIHCVLSYFDYIYSLVTNLDGALIFNWK